MSDIQIETDSEWNPYKSHEAEIESLRQQLADLTNVHNQTVSNGIAGFEAIKQQLAECQATNGKLREALEFLWNIIDDIDTYSDMAKFDNSLFRTLVERRQADRWKTGITTDGYSLNIPALPNDAKALNELIAERTASLTAEVEALTIERDLNVRQANAYQQQNAELTAQRDVAITALETARALLVEANPKCSQKYLFGVITGAFKRLDSTIANCNNKEK